MSITAQLAEPDSISGQLDLSAASREKAHDTASATARVHAREDEARDDHGRWARMPGQASAVPVRDSLISEKGQAERFSEIWQRLAMAGDHLEHEPLAAAGHIREAARLAAASGDRDTADRYEALAARVTADATDHQGSQQAAHAFTAKAAPAVPGLLGGGHEAWNGQLDVFPQAGKPTILAEIGWDGKISMSDAVAGSIKTALADPHATVTDPAAFSVALHELIHGVTADGETYRSHSRAYQDKNTAMIEEGFTELGTVQHMPEFLDQMGIGDRPTSMLAMTGAGDLKETLDKQQVATAARTIEGLKSFDLPAAVNQRLDAAVSALGNDDAKSASMYIAQAAVRITDPEVKRHLLDAAQAASLISGEPHHATMAEYAKRLQDPDRVGKGNAWGHYPQQTAAAQQWTRNVAMNEAVGTTGGKLKADAMAKGSKSPLVQARMGELADEINRQGAAGKLGAMAAQVMRLAGAPDQDTDAGRLSALTAETIRKNWQMGNSSAFQSALKLAQQWAPTISAQASLEWWL
jgi:hypothetical protein